MSILKDVQINLNHRFNLIVFNSTNKPGHYSATTNVPGGITVLPLAFSN